MASYYGNYMKKLRKKQKENMRTMASRLGVSPAFISSIESGRKTIPMEYAEKISALYNLSDKEKNEIVDAINISNKNVKIQIENFDSDRKDVSLMFARKINTADKDLIKKLKEALNEDKD